MITRKLALILAFLGLVGGIGITQCAKKECQCSHGSAP